MDRDLILFPLWLHIHKELKLIPRDVWLVDTVPGRIPFSPLIVPDVYDSNLQQQKI